MLPPYFISNLAEYSPFFDTENDDVTSGIEDERDEDKREDADKDEDRCVDEAFDNEVGFLVTQFAGVLCGVNGCADGDDEEDDEEGSKTTSEDIVRIIWAIGSRHTGHFESGLVNASLLAHLRHSTL